MSLINLRVSMDQHKIAFGVYNQEDRINNTEMYLRAKGSTLFYLQRLSGKQQTKLTIICDNDIKNILQQAHEQGFDYCVVVAAGCQVRNLGFIEDLNEFINNNKFGVAGHPLWKPDGRWLELHHQFFIVNLEAWKQVGCPAFGHWESEPRLLPVVIRSEENFHDDYTPLWIRPTGEVAVQNYPCQGWQLISEMMMGKWPVITLTEKIRLSKFYTYPEHETEKFLESIKAVTPYSGQNWNQNKWIEDSLLVKDQIWLFNSESMDIHNNNGPYDLIVSTASGFKILDMFKHPRLTNTARAIIYDFNPKSLAWYEHFYKWSNQDLGSCITAFPDKDCFTWIGQFKSTFEENAGFEQGLKELYDHFGGMHKFAEYWIEFKKMPVEFHQVDLYRKPERLAELMTGPGRKWVNLTNIFSTDATQLIFGHAECMAAQQRCLAELYVIDPDIDVTLFDFWNRHKYGQLKYIL